MIRVYTAEDMALVNHLKNILVVNNIACTLINGPVSARPRFATGEAPPEIWLHDPTDFEKAQRLIETGLKLEASELLDWRCPQCNEVHASQFSRCWKCGFHAETYHPDQNSAS